MTDLPVDPDAQATVNDFLDYTEYLPSDLTRSLTLIRNLDERYLLSATKVHNLAVAYSQIPNVSPEHRHNSQYLRENISTNLDYAIRSRESSYAEARRLSEVIDRYFNRLTSIISKLNSLPKPPSRDPTPVPLQSLASSRRNKSGFKDDGRHKKPPFKKGLDGTPHPRIRLRLEGPRATGSSGRVMGTATRPRHRTQKVTVPGEVLPPRNPDSPSSDTDSEWEFRPPSPVPMATSRVGVPSRNRLIKTTPKPLKTPKTPRIRIPKDLKAPHTPSHKSPNEPRSPGGIGTNVHSSIAGISTTNAISLLQPPPSDAKPGSEHAPWLSLTEWEMAKLRKRMKKNAVWVPSSTRIRRELTEAGRGPENYRIQKAKADASGEEFIDEANIATTIRVRPLAQGEISAGPLGPEETGLTNKGTQLNEAKKLKRERLAREAAAEAASQAEQAAKKLGDIGNAFKNLFPRTPTKANGNPSQSGANPNAKRTAKATEARKEKARERKRKLEQLAEQQRLEIETQRQPKLPDLVAQVSESETEERHVMDVDMPAETRMDPQEQQNSKEAEDQKEGYDAERYEPSGEEIVVYRRNGSESKIEIDNQSESENESGTESGTDGGDEGDGEVKNALINEQAQDKAKEEEMEREQERERQREITLQIERQREIALQIERQRELEKQRVAEIEIQKQREFEKAKQRAEEIERERERAAQREKELEVERIKKQRQREMEIEKEQEMAKQREKAIEMEREREQEREIARQKAMEEEREKEREMQRETERQVQREMEIRQEMAQKLLEEQQRQQKLEQGEQEQEQIEDGEEEGEEDEVEEEHDEDDEDDEDEEEEIVAVEHGEKEKGGEAISILIPTKGKRAISPSPIETTDPQHEPSTKRRRINERREASNILSTAAKTSAIPLAPEASPPLISIAATPQVKNFKGIPRNDTPVTRSRRLSLTLKGPAPQVEPIPSRTRPSPRTSRSTIAAHTHASNARELPSRSRPNARTPSRRSSTVDQAPTAIDREHLRRKPSTPAAAPHTIPTTPSSRLRKRPEVAAAASEGPQRSSAGKAGSAAATNARRAAKDTKVQEGEEEEEEEVVENTEEDPDMDPRYCYCNDVSYGTMIWCEHPKCKYNWFHLKCVGMSKAPPKEVKWYCDECRARPGKK